jgi:integrase
MQKSDLGRRWKWQQQTPHAKQVDFVFPSMKSEGRVPLSPCAFVADHLRPEAKQAGVQIEDGKRFGLHNLRHSLSNWLVNKAKVEPKTVQGILGHAKVQTTLDLYRQEGDEARAVQGEFLQALGIEPQLVQWRWARLWVRDLRERAAKPLEIMVGPCELEPQISAASIV